MVSIIIEQNSSVAFIFSPFFLSLSALSFNFFLIFFKIMLVNGLEHKGHVHYCDNYYSSQELFL